MTSQIRIESKEDAFSWAVALFTWLSENNEGDKSHEYEAMTKLIVVHQLVVRGGMEEEDREKYEEITKENWKQIFERFEDYMITKWGDDE